MARSVRERDGLDGIDRAGNDEAARRLLRPAEDASSPSDHDAPGASRGVAQVHHLSGDVSGAGSGAGGGNAGEDFDDDHTAGSATAR